MRIKLGTFLDHKLQIEIIFTRKIDFFKIHFNAI